MTRRRRTTLLVGAVVVLALVAGTVGLVLALRGPGPEDAAEDYLTAQWTGDARTQCDLATEQWQHVLFEGHPFPDCAAFASAAKEADGDDGFLAYADDTDLQVALQTTEAGDGQARVAYVLTFRYHGADRAGFDALWQGGDPVDRGTVLLAQVDGDWRVAGVDAG